MEFVTLVGIFQEFYEACREAAAHKGSCKALSDRAKAICDNICSARKTLGSSRQLDALVAKVNEATAFVRQFNKRGWMGRMCNRKDDERVPYLRPTPL